MNALSTFWQGIVDTLNENKSILGIGTTGDPDNPDDLGLPGAERAKTGQVTTLLPPSVAVWIQPQPATFISQNGAVYLLIDVHIFCVGAPTTDEAGSVDGAIDIAIAILKFLTGKEISGTVLYQPDTETVIEIIESSSSQSVVGVLMKAQVSYD